MDLHNKKLSGIVIQRLKKTILEGEFSHNLPDEKSLANLVLNTGLIGNKNHFLLTILVIEYLSTSFINYRYHKVHKHQRLPNFHTFKTYCKLWRSGHQTDLESPAFTYHFTLAKPIANFSENSVILT